MTESDAQGAMAESPNLMLKARETLATPSLEGLESVLDQFSSTLQETTVHQRALALLNFCTAHFANCLTLKLLKLYQCSSNGLLRFHSIFLLSANLYDLRTRRFELSLIALNDIKPVLISCLKIQETKEAETKILGRIVSFVAYDVFMLDNEGWDELSDFIFELASTDPRKAFHVFVDLPPVYERFIYRCGPIIAEKAEKVLLLNAQESADDWCLALQAIVKLSIQLLDLNVRIDVVRSLLSNLVKSASDLVVKGMEQLLLRGLHDLEMFLSRDKNFFNYNKDQCDFVSSFMFKIRELGTHTKAAAKKINRLVQSFPSLVQEVPQDRGPRTQREWFDHLQNLSPLEILRIVASTGLEEMPRDMAIRRLNVLVSDHTSREEEIDISEMRELQPLLIYCISKEEGISQSMFEVLGEVVYHVASEMMNVEMETWYGLRDYLVSKCKTEFQRAVYIFQCLKIWLEDDFVIPVMNSLLPEISSRLDPPREVLVDNSCWVLAFVGAFCAAIHLLGIARHDAKHITEKMIGSVRELVERNMEVGLVRRAFRDVESIVKKQNEWFGMNEYKFIKGLLRRLYVIKGMKMESKMVLWRINVFVERGMTKLAKELPDDLPDDDDDDDDEVVAA